MPGLFEAARLRIKTLLACTLALLLPLNGTTYLVHDLRAPAHHHIVAQFGDPDLPAHFHTQTEHHPHAADDDVIVDEDDHRHAQGMEEASSKRVAGFSGDALPATCLSARGHSALAQPRGANAAKSAPAFIGRLERPPKSACSLDPLLG